MNKTITDKDILLNETHDIVISAGDEDKITLPFTANVGDQKVITNLSGACVIVDPLSGPIYRIDEKNQTIVYQFHGDAWRMISVT